MNLIKNYYTYLGIPDLSSEKVIRKAYKKKSLLVHPDKLKVDSSEEFNKLKNIYDILSDPVKKAEYDKKLNSVREQEKRESEMTEKYRKLREKFRLQEEEADRKKKEKEKEKYVQLRKADIARRNEIDFMIFEKKMEEKRRKKMEEIMKLARQQQQPELSDTEYTEEEVMKMMGL